MQLPFKSLDEISLQARLGELSEQNHPEGPIARSADSPNAPPLL
jgi:hypothetical protein